MVDNQLILDIKNGDKSKLPELWCSVKNWAYSVANKFYLSKQIYCDAKGFTAEDLQQTGYFALLDALKSYNSDEGSNFITWYTYYLTRQFAKEIHLYSGEQNYQANFDANIKSLNEEIRSNCDEVERIELIPDEHDYIAEVDDKLESESLHKMLDDFIDDVLSDVDAAIIRKKYWDDKPVKQISEEMKDYSDKTVYRKIRYGLCTLRKNAHMMDYNGQRISRNRLMNYLEQTDPFTHIATGEQIRNHTSIPEQIVLRKESYGML